MTITSFNFRAGLGYCVEARRCLSDYVRILPGELLTIVKFAILDTDSIAREELRLLVHSKAEVDVFSSADEFQRHGSLGEYDCLLADTTVARGVHLGLLHAGLSTPLIYLSSQPSISEAVAAVKLGAVDYLRKPVVAEELLSALETAARQKRSGVPDRFFRTGLELDSMVNSMERELICAALHNTHGVVGGSRGAAAMLGVTRTGLLYKMKRLGVSRELVASSEDTSEEEPRAQLSAAINSSTTT